ncbi:MAG: UDP-N-acetylmuramate:L-alanyl-gamma-D-glutamyl-meso-diaminopimelate ligase [Acidiferrobacteraceae bacterium]
MHLHILGIGGTFMAGLAALGKEQGHRITGSDLAIYPPMSTQLKTLGIEWSEGYDQAFLDPRPDLVIIGNVLSRGNPAIEALLDSDVPYLSGPEWLAQAVLRDRWVLAVAGTHGKTTTASLLAFILEDAGLAPGFLIGGMPANFGISARLGARPFFVIEADEYDTAFFDKRAKFIHYRPRTAVLNNLEYDHADIYPDLASISRQFHHLVRTVPRSGLIVANGLDPAIDATLAQGVWTPVERFDVNEEWSAQSVGDDDTRFTVFWRGAPVGEVRWDLIGRHNRANALAAIAAARHAGVPPAQAAASLGRFLGVRRRLEVRGRVAGVTVYDDFAHHPTAIRTTLAGLGARFPGERLIAVLEPRSNTMKLGVHRDSLPDALMRADRVFLFAPPDLGWDVCAVARALPPGKAECLSALPDLLDALDRELRPGDHAVLMSNGSFGGLHERLLERLKARAADQATF